MNSDVTLTIPTRLSVLVPEDLPGAPADRATLSLCGATWSELVQQLSDRFPRLANRVLSSPGELSAGFALVVNDELRPRSEHPSLVLQPGDELLIIEVFSGG